ncbi:MAG: carboxypeptidase M32 [Treponema sp.]|nr:carboxypeptidase M32 [Treponema sp.]
MKLTENLEKIRAANREYCRLGKIVATLQWDMETYMPPEGIKERSEQLALIEGLAHARLADPENGRLLAELGSTEEEPGGDEELPARDRDFVRVLRRNYDRAILLPAEFVGEAAKARGFSQAAWAAARKANDFKAFLPHLRTMIDTERKRAAYWGFGSEGKSLYDGLLDMYEPGMGVAQITPLFAVLRERLSALVKEIGKRERPDTSFLDREFPVEKQREFSDSVLDAIMFSTKRGRLDLSAHPFTISLGPDDVRITTRYFPKNLLSGLFSVIHEAGHAIYEMGFPEELRGTSLADGASMGIHESQSRLWENVIGRGLPFWKNKFPGLKSAFPEQLGKVELPEFYRAVNEVKPSLIRVDADEVSYGLHVILRFELEQGMISGEIDPEKLPEIWREKMREYFGIEIDPAGPRSDADGVLQDVHWSMGAFGYFPSYLLGNLYGLHFWRRIREDIPDFDTRIIQGDFGPLRSWIDDNICRWGARLEPARLLHEVCGLELRAEPFLEYVEAKYRDLYGIPAGV